MAEIAEQPDRARTVTALADLPPKALLDEAALAQALGVGKRTVRRMVARFELPPPIPLAGRSTWIVERVLTHLDERAARVARKAEQEARRIEALPFAYKKTEKSSDSLKEPVATGPK